MTAGAAFVKSAVATSAAVLLVAHREQVHRRPAGVEPAGAGCPVMRRLGRIPEQHVPADPAPAFPDYSV
jgi:hypothetical protein